MLFSLLPLCLHLHLAQVQVSPVDIYPNTAANGAGAATCMDRP